MGLDFEIEHNFHLIFSQTSLMDVGSIWFPLLQVFYYEFREVLQHIVLMEYLLVVPSVITQLPLLKINNRNTRKRRDVCSKLTIETLERRQCIIRLQSVTLRKKSSYSEFFWSVFFHIQTQNTDTFYAV